MLILDLPLIKQVIHMYTLALQRQIIPLIKGRAYSTVYIGTVIIISKHRYWQFRFRCS